MIPLQVRKELGIEEGTELVVAVSDGLIQMQTREQAIARAQEFCRRLKPGRGSVVESFLKERRREARKELGS